MKATPEQPTPENLQHWFHSHLAHFNEGRFDTYFKDLSEDAVYILGPKLRLDGKEDIVSWYRSRFTAVTSHHWEGDLQFRVSGATGIAEGTFRSRMQDEIGAARVLGGNVLLVFHWNGETWLKLAEHVTLDPA